MKEIYLTRGKVALVDDEDYNRVSQYKWHTCEDGNIFYAHGRVRGKEIQMHRFILNAKIGEITDHIDGDGLNNQKTNLRFVTKSQNSVHGRKFKMYNGKTCSSKYKGVSKDGNLWHSRIIFEGKYINLGWFKNEEDAARVYDDKMIELQGVYGKLNFPI